MSKFRLKNRILTPPVARAMVSPGAIIAVGAGASVGIITGLPLLAAVGLGAVAWLTRVGFAIPRKPSREKIDPFSLNEPWRGFVREALEASKQFDEAIRRVPSGPLRERLDELAGRVRTGIDETWRIACAGQDLSDARAKIDVVDITRQLSEVSGPSGPIVTTDGPRAQTVAALDAQLATAQRMDRVITETRDRLRLIDAKRDEAVTRAIELSARPSDGIETPGLTGLDRQVSSLVEEMDSLRQALDETG